MTQYVFFWFSLLMSASITTLMLWFGQPIAYRVDLLDHSNERTLHEKAVPVIGGLAMGVGFLSTLLLMSSLWQSWKLFFVASSLMLLLGCLDDCKEIKVKYRFVIQFLIAWLVVEVGGVVYTLGDLLGLGMITPGRWAILITLISIVGVINAVNMSDGLDGQAGGQSLISFLMLFFMAAYGNRWQEAWVLLIFVAVLIPFLLFNAPLFSDKPAQVFMGDAGSTFLGMALAWFAISLSQGPAPVLSPVTALWLVAVPLIDLFSSIFRRILTRRSVFKPDLGHIHHALLWRGYSKRQVFFIMTGLSAILGLLGIGSFLLAVPDVVMFGGFISLFIGYCSFGLRGSLNSGTNFSQERRDVWRAQLIPTHFFTK